MKRKLFLVLLMALMLMCLLAVGISAKEAYVEKVPSNLIYSGEALEYFIVLDGEEYYTADNTVLTGLDSTDIEAALNALASEGEYPDAVTGLGTRYLIKFVLPATVNGKQMANAYINNSSFKANTYFSNYCGAIVYAPTYTQTGDANQHNSNIRSIDFGENSCIKQIPLSYMQNANKLRELKNFPKNLTSIEDSAFSYCNLQGVLYVNAVTVKRKAFENAIRQIDGIIIGKDTVNIYTEAFGTKEKDGSRYTKFIEFQGDVTKMNIVGSASNQGAFYFASGTQRNPYSALTCLVLSHPDNQAMINEGVTTFQDFLPNVYFNQESMNGGNLVRKSHDNVESISYDSFLENGAKYGVCKICAYAGEAVSVDPLFECLGYSTPENGACAIVLGYKADKTAISEYERITNNTVAYGIFVVSRSNIGDNDIFGADGTPAKGVISTTMSSLKFSYFDIKIVGIEKDEYKSAEIAMGTYVSVSDGENVEYSYLQSDKPAENEKYSFVSYNSIVK